jgi:hypothetical protein
VPALQHRSLRPLDPFDPAQGVVVKEPRQAEPGYWAGAPAVLYEPRRQRFLMTYRERRPRGKEPERGWRCALAESTDGVQFADVWEVRKEELQTSSMERFCLVPGPGGRYRLYISYVDPADNRWRVDAIDAGDPGAFDIASARPVLTADRTGTEGVKDPCVLRIGPVTYLLASFAAARPFGPGERERAHSTGDIYNTGVTIHPTGIAISLDGTEFGWRGPVLEVGGAWDRYQARLNCVLPLGPGYLGFYDGSASAKENYEERCGVAVSADLRRWERLTPDRPWISGPHATGSARYFDAVAVGDEWWIYYELTRPDGAHDLRLYRTRAS